MRVILSLVLGVSLTAACVRDPGPDVASTGSLDVVASFYPLAHVAEQVGGDAVTVRNLTPPGVEPHDLELTPDDLEAIATADVVISLGAGFQPAVEDAVEAEATGPTIDVLEGVELLPSGDDEFVGDPHVWLDPAIYGDIAERVASALAESDRARADAYTENAGRFRAELLGLDAEFRDGLASCTTRVMITNHAAFGYLAAAYDLEQEAISGLSPDAEPDPGRIAELAAEARERGATTVFTEDLVSAEVAETLAAEAGIETAVLSPLEGLTDEQVASGDDYLSVMRQNLEKLRDGLACS